MAKYRYRITDKFGKERTGTMDANSEEAARAKLKGDGSVVLEIREATDIANASWNVSIGNPVKKKDITLFCRQFHSMLVAGVTVVEGLKIVQDQTDNKALKKALFNVQVNVEKGETLAEAMKMEGKVFPELLIHMVAAGEVTGNLELSFDRICTQFEKDMKLGSMIKSAMIYPIVVLVVAIIVVIVLLTTVIPNFQSTFESMDAELPGLTQAVVGASEFVMEHYIALAVGAVIFFIAIITAKGTEKGKMVTSWLCLHLPLVKGLTVKNAAAKFSSTMSTLVMSGVPLVESLDIVADVIPNRIIRETVRNCKEEVMQGIPLSEPIEASGVFPSMVHHMIKIGEETGTTEQMLDKVAGYFEDEVEDATRNLTTVMEPAIIILLAGLVGSVIGAILMPMLEIYNMAEGA